MALKGIYRPGYKYIKTGVTLRELSPLTCRQANLFDNMAANAKSAALMQVLDSVNAV